MTASVGDMEQGIHHILTWMCNTVGMRRISPLADILIRMVLTVLRTEKETYEKKVRGFILTHWPRGDMVLTLLLPEDLDEIFDKQFAR